MAAATAERDGDDMVGRGVQERAWVDEYQILEAKIRACEEELTDIDDQQCVLIRRGYQLRKEIAGAESRQQEIFDQVC